MAHRSQLLYRLIQCLFGYTYDYGKVIWGYLPITFTKYWTYSRSLHKYKGFRSAAVIQE